MYLFLIALDVCCYAWAFSSCECRLLFVVMHALITAVASLTAEHSLYSIGSVVVVHGFSCSSACGIFPDQRLNWCPCVARQTLNHWTTRVYTLDFEGLM